MKFPFTGALDGWTREFLIQLCLIRLLPETSDCPKEEIV